MRIIATDVGFGEDYNKYDGCNENKFDRQICRCSKEPPLPKRPPPQKLMMKLSTYRGGTTPHTYSDVDWWEDSQPFNAGDSADGMWQTAADDIKTARYSEPIGKCCFRWRARPCCAT